MMQKFLVIDADGNMSLEDPNVHGEFRGSMHQLNTAHAVVKVSIDESANLTIEPVKLRGQLFLED